MLVEVTAPVEFQSAVTNNIIKKRGLMVGNESDGEYFTFQAEVGPKLYNRLANFVRFKKPLNQNFLNRFRQGSCLKHFLIQNSLKRFILLSHVLETF